MALGGGRGRDGARGAGGHGASVAWRVAVVVERRGAFPLSETHAGEGQNKEIPAAPLQRRCSRSDDNKNSSTRKNTQPRADFKTEFLD